jgi:hypothetical protein
MHIRSTSMRPARLVAGACIAVLFAACSAESPTSAMMPIDAPSFSRVAAPSTSMSLGSAAAFGVLGATTVTCTGASAIAGDVGVSPGSAITGFNPDCTLTGTLHAGDAVAAAAEADAAIAYANLSLTPCTQTFGSVQELSGLTLSPGVYCFPSSAVLSAGGTLTLTGSGPYIFKITSTLVTFTNSQIVLTGNAACSSVVWLVGSSATLAGSVVGNIIAWTSIGMDPGASLTGRALALHGAVTMSGGNTVSLCGTTGGKGNVKQKCNQGVGNGTEGCDPGNSNHINGSNDENGGIPGAPGRKP